MMNLFTYGSLMFPEVMHALTERVFQYEDASLSGFDRYLLNGRKYPGIIENTDSRVEGRVFFDIDSTSLEILDQFENSIYERRIVEIHTISRAQVKARAYIVPVTAREALSELRWSADEFSRAHLANYVEMCRRFRAELCQQGC